MQEGVQKAQTGCRIDGVARIPEVDVARPPSGIPRPSGRQEPAHFSALKQESHRCPFVALPPPNWRLTDCCNVGSSSSRRSIRDRRRGFRRRNGSPDRLQCCYCCTLPLFAIGAATVHPSICQRCASQLLACRFSRRESPTARQDTFRRRRLRRRRRCRADAVATRYIDDATDCPDRSAQRTSVCLRLCGRSRRTAFRHRLCHLAD
jgi:hypothetical protein